MPKKPCARPGCPQLVTSGYCETCKPYSAAAVSERARGTAASRGYGYRWQKTSAGFLKTHPLCADPYGRHKDFPQPATMTDHIVAHKGDMRLFWDPRNWQPLCDSCNSYKAFREEGVFGRPRSVNANGFGAAT